MLRRYSRDLGYTNLNVNDEDGGTNYFLCIFDRTTFILFRFELESRRHETLDFLNSIIQSGKNPQQ